MFLAGILVAFLPMLCILFLGAVSMRRTARICLHNAVVLRRDYNKKPRRVRVRSRK